MSQVLLLENIHTSAEKVLSSGTNSLTIHRESGALSGQELVSALENKSLLGIRSRTKISAEILNQIPELSAIGCFCIGTNQVDLSAAAQAGVPVFNAPFSNTRSVAELAISSIIQLFRQIPIKNTAAHQGQWLKSASRCFEVRQKKLGIIGYGNIGSQLSVLASGMGMHVYYYDTVPKLSHGNARSVDSLEELLKLSDVVSLHVPADPSTKNLINAQTLAQMKPGSLLINYARGDVVDISALTQALKSGQLSGAAVDVFPEEPSSNDAEFISPLRGLPNVILTPHVGGSTEEAQANIGAEVAQKLRAFWMQGDTQGAVNFPPVSLPLPERGWRLLHVHRNQPGALEKINHVLSAQNLNVSGQFLQTNQSIGYVILDVEPSGNPDQDQLLNALQAISGTIRARLITSN